MLWNSVVQLFDSRLWIKSNVVDSYLVYTPHFVHRITWISKQVASSIRL